MRDDGAGAGKEIARARVVAEALPGMQHLVERSRGKRAQVGPAREERARNRPDGRDGGLLQHDLAEPDAVRIGPLAWPRAPRQVAAVPVVPGEERLR